MALSERPSPFRGRITEHERKKNVEKFFKMKMSSFKLRKNKHSITKTDFKVFLLDHDTMPKTFCFRL